MEKQYRFQLITPVVSNKIYLTNSVQKGAGKCFEELKGCGANNFNQFTIMNVDNFETYKFAIDKKRNHLTNNKIGISSNINNQNGGDNTNNMPTAEMVNDVKQFTDSNKVVRLEKAVVALSDKVILLEEQINKLNKMIIVDKEPKTCDISNKEPRSCGVNKNINNNCSINQQSMNMSPSNKDVYKTNLNKLDKIQKSIVEDF